MNAGVPSIVPQLVLQLVMNRIRTIFTYSDPQRAIDAVITKDRSGITNYTGSLNSIRNDQGDNLLHIATLNGDCDMVKYLLEHGVDKNHKNKFLYTPWDYAKWLRNDDIINLYTERESRYISIWKAENCSLQKEVSDLNKEVVILKKNNKRLLDSNSELQLKVGTLTSEKESLVRDYEEIRKERDGMTQAFKRKRLK
jgi:ankyrin repeat protein